MQNINKKTPQTLVIKGEIEFKNVSFGYEPDKLIIKNFSTSVKSGQKIAIVWPTGAWKTTLVNLLMRFYEINSWQILIDWIDTKSVKREEIHELFAMVLQDTWIFDGTILENIIYDKKDVWKEQVVEVCKQIGLHHFIETLENGYETILDDKSTISQWQRQLLTIARAIIKDAPIIILDEATSSVDTRTEELVQIAMDTLMKWRTSFVIAHRLSTIKNADLILVLKDGDVVEKWTHKELLKEKWFYADLYNSQFEKVK